jgi:shikimate kinase
MMFRIYIIGMPGTGKTHFGRMLAQSLKMQFFDLDEMLEKQELTSVKLVITEKGEPYFRQQEHEMLKKTLGYNNCVVSCGGGTPFHFNNMDLMKLNGIVIWLNTDLRIIKKRIVQNSTRRPLFLGLSEGEILEKLNVLYENRRRTYAKADVLIDHNQQHAVSLSAVIQKVMKHFKNKRR